MLGIFIEKLELIEGHLYISARVLEPYFDTNKVNYSSPKEIAEAKVLHDKLRDEYDHLHLGNAHLQHAEGD